MNVYIVTCLDLGWDCVVAVFDAKSVDYNELVEKFGPEHYVIHDNKVEVDLNGWD